MIATSIMMGQNRPEAGGNQDHTQVAEGPSHSWRERHQDDLDFTSQGPGGERLLG